MKTSLVITLLADDRPGLVSELSELLRSHQANWMESRFVRLAGKFAGLLQVAVDEAQRPALTAALQAMQQEGFQIQIEADGADAAPAGRSTLKLEVLGQDRPGIVEDISQELAALDVNIEEMLSEQRLASMSNEVLFFAALTLGLPDGVSPDDVRNRLESMSDQLMVDLNFSAED